MVEHHAVNVEAPGSSPGSDAFSSYMVTSMEFNSSRETMEYTTEELIKMKKQYELAAEVVDIAIEKQKSNTKTDDIQKHVIQSSECAKEGLSLV